MKMALCGTAKTPGMRMIPLGPGTELGKKTTGLGKTTPPGKKLRLQILLVLLLQASTGVKAKATVAIEIAPCAAPSGTVKEIVQLPAAKTVARKALERAVRAKEKVRKANLTMTRWT